MFTTPAGRPASSKCLCEGQYVERRLLRRLEDDGAAGANRRRQLPCRHQQRIVPRDDLGGDTDGSRNASLSAPPAPARPRHESSWPDRRSTRSTPPRLTMSYSASTIGFPVLRVSSAASSPARALTTSASFRRIRPRSTAGVRAQSLSSNAHRAAATAWSTSSAVASGTWQRLRGSPDR